MRALGLNEIDARGFDLNLRRHMRRSTKWPATCSDRSGLAWQAWVVDHSPGGIGLENCPPLEVDQTIEVELPGIGKFLCRVAWCADKRFGVEILQSPGQLTDEELNILADLLSR